MTGPGGWHCGCHIPAEVWVLPDVGLHRPGPHPSLGRDSAEGVLAVAAAPASVGSSVIPACSLGIGVVFGKSKMMEKFGGKGEGLQNMTEMECFPSKKQKTKTKTQ